MKRPLKNIIDIETMYANVSFFCSPGILSFVNRPKPNNNVVTLIVKAHDSNRFKYACSYGLANEKTTINTNNNTRAAHVCNIGPDGRNKTATIVKSDLRIVFQSSNHHTFSLNPENKKP